MKFELFERLRGGDDDTGNTGTTTPPTQSQGLGEPQRDGGPDLQGGGLERTVENMFQQGYSEDEIRQELQGQYSNQEIQSAVNQTVTNKATSKDGPEPMTPYESDDEPVSPMDEGYDEEPRGQENQNPQNPQNMDQGPEPRNQGTQMQNNQPQPEPIQQEGEEPRQQNGNIDRKTEELIETIVAENFQRVTAEFENVYNELDLLEEELEDLEHRVHDLEVRDEEDQEAFIQKVDEMEEHIDSYQSRIGGLEKAFQQVLPNLVDNVRDLTSLVQEIKQEKGVETSTNVSKQDMEEMDEQLQDW